MRKPTEYLEKPHCSVLRCVAVCCSVLQCVAVCYGALQYIAVCCNVLQCVAVCCTLLTFGSLAEFVARLVTAAVFGT